MSEPDEPLPDLAADELLKLRWYRAETERLRVLGTIAARFVPPIGQEYEPGGHEIEIPTAVADARDMMLIAIFHAIFEAAGFTDSATE